MRASLPYDVIKAVEEALRAVRTEAGERESVVRARVEVCWFNGNENFALWQNSLFLVVDLGLAQHPLGADIVLQYAASAATTPGADLGIYHIGIPNVFGQ